MAKIAAIILPSGREKELPRLQDGMRRSLCLAAHHQAEVQTYRGDRAVCALLRIAPDPLNSAIQPLQSDHAGCVMCGYYLWPSTYGDGSAERLFTDLVREGVDALPRADGVYGFAYWDARNEQLITGVDKLGMRPLYWTGLPGGGYAVASEIKALVGLLDELNIDWSAWEEHLTFGYLFGEHTFFEGIQRFGAAETIAFRHDGHDSRIVEHFLDTIDIRDRPVDAFVEEQGAVFDETMKRLAGLYDAPHRTMLTLSGGFDSRRAFGWLLNHDVRPDVYTVPDVREDGTEFESAIVRELCRTVDIDGTLIYPLTVADRIRVRQVRDLATDFESDEHNVSTVLAMGVDCHDRVNFDGLAAGSQLSGSFMDPAYFSPGGKDRFMAAWPRPVRDWLRLPRGDASAITTRARAELDRWGDNPNRFAYFYLLSRTRREVALAPLSLQANVFESLCPYLDREMMRNAFSFPPVKKVGANLQLAMIARLHPELGRLPTTYTPGIEGNPRYRMRTEGIELGARRELLRRVAYRPRNSLAWSAAGVQKWRFRIAGMVAAFHGGGRLHWEFGKAAKIGQLTHFEESSRSPATYGAAVATLAQAYAARKDWCRRL